MKRIQPWSETSSIEAFTPKSMRPIGYQVSLVDAGLEKLGLCQIGLCELVGLFLVLLGGGLK